MVDQVPVDVEVEVLDAEGLLDLVDAGLGGRRRAVLLVDVVVLAGLQRGHDAREPVVGVGRGLGDAGDDQRRARLVDEDRVDLVHDAEVVAALDAVGQPHGHVVAQVVEAELGVGAVGDVRRVRLAPVALGHHRRDHPDADAERGVDGAHPLRVAAGQVVVDRDEVHAAAREGVEIDGRHRREGLALAGLHLGDLPGVQGHRPDELDVEEAQAEDPPAGLADQRERLVQDVVERLAVLQARPELVGLGPHLGVGELLHRRLEVVDVRDPALHALHRTALADAEDLVEEIGAHGWARGIVGTTPPMLAQGSPAPPAPGPSLSPRGRSTRSRRRAGGTPRSPSRRHRCGRRRSRDGACPCGARRPRATSASCRSSCS